MRSKLRSRRNTRPTIGLLIDVTYGKGRWYQSKIWAGVMTAAQKRNINLVCFAGGTLERWPSNEFEGQRNILYDLVTTESIDGLIVCGAIGSYATHNKFKLLCDHYFEYLKTCYPKLPIPPLISIAEPLPYSPSILVDNQGGVRETIRHLVKEHDYRRIAFIRGPTDNSEAEERYLAYQSALNEFQLLFDPQHLVVPGDFLLSSGRDAVRILYDERKVKPDAIVAANDYMALGAIEALKARGIHIPQDVAITGFDNIEDCCSSSPSLTTVRQPVAEQTDKAVERLVAIMQGEDSDNDEILHTELIVRQSCGCPDLAMAETAIDVAPGTSETGSASLLINRINILHNMDPRLQVEHTERLIDAFKADLEGETQSAFLSMLEEMLQQAVLVNGDTALWQREISAIRRFMLPHFTGTPALTRAESLWQQARVLISERAQQAQGHRWAQSEQQGETLHELSQSLVSTSDISELMGILAHGLGQLRIPSCCISLYENPVMPKNWCKSILVYQEGTAAKHSGEHFPSPQLIPNDLLEQLPIDRPYSLVVEPLHFRENQLGLAVFEVGPREGYVYEILRGQISSALWASNLVQNIRSLYEASNSVIALKEPSEILNYMAEKASKAVNAWSANIVVYEKKGRPVRLATGGEKQNSMDTDAFSASEAVAAKVMIEHKPAPIEDTQQDMDDPVNKGFVDKGVRAAICLPMTLSDRPIGVMWVFYQQPHRFPSTEIDALGLYANQAAIAYDHAKRIKEMEHLRQAAEKLAGVADVQKVLQEIVRSAGEVLQSDSAVIWVYDAGRNVFLQGEMVAENVMPLKLKKHSDEKPRPGGTAANVIQRGYLAVTDVTSSEFDFLNQPGRGLREEIGVRAFQGIALQVEGESLGVLYVNYKEPQEFDAHDKATLESFAHHAALALKKARLLEQVRRTKETARVVANVSVHGELQRTLQAVVRGTKHALGCDAVVLYVYQHKTQKLNHPPIMVGVNYPDRAVNAGEVLKDSLVYVMLRRDEPYIVDDNAKDPLFARRRFTTEEQIESCAVLPLKAADQSVGVMFVNYRKHHNFKTEELEDLKLFADLAASAIRDAHLIIETEKTANYLKTLYEAGKLVTGTLALEEILKRIVEEASQLTKSTGGKQSHYCYLALKEGDELVFKAAYSPRNRRELFEKNYRINLVHDSRIGIVGRAVITGKSQLVPNVSRDPDYIVDDQDTMSVLAVPIKIGGDIIGVIDVEHSDHGAFDDEDQEALEALAAQAAIAIKNANLYEETKQRANQLITASEVARNAAAILDVKELLDQTVNLISARFPFYHTGIFLLDIDGANAILRAASSEGGKKLLENGHCLSVGKDGIVGEVAGSSLLRVTQDVKKDPLYYANPFLPDTRSEMALPMRVHKKVIGVLDVQSTQYSAFTQSDETVLQTMADHLAIAVENARNFEDLKRIKGFIGNKTVLDWIRMVSTTWGHSIRREVGTALAHIKLLSNYISKGRPEREQREELEQLKRVLSDLKDIPIVAPLSSEDGVTSIQINELISTYMQRQWSHSRFSSVQLHLDLQRNIDTIVTVRASQEWLKRALELVIDNAVYAMSEAESPERCVFVSARLANDNTQVVLSIRDTGPGIKKEVLDHLFERPVDKPEGSRGSGIGLMLAQTIVQTYGGDLSVNRSISDGAEFIFTLPARKLGE